MRYIPTNGPVAREAWPFTVPPILVMLWCLVFGMYGWAILLALAVVYVLYFFRNPDRLTPAGERLVIAPADGKIVAAGVVPHPDFEDGQALRIAIFMSLFDCHINWAPYNMQVDTADHFCGKFLNAMESKSCEENERKVLTGRAPGDVPIVVKLVAGLVARRIVCPIAAGDQLERGDKIGLIRFGSRVETLLPANALLHVQVGEKVRGGESVLATLPAGGDKA